MFIINCYVYQDLTITISTERGEEEIGLEPDTSELSSVNVQSFVDEQEWYLHKHIDHLSKVTTNAYRNTKHKHPALSVSCKATRRFQFFFWNIILVMVSERCNSSYFLKHRSSFCEWTVRL